VVKLRQNNETAHHEFLPLRLCKFEAVTGAMFAFLPNQSNYSGRECCCLRRAFLVPHYKTSATGGVFGFLSSGNEALAENVSARCKSASSQETTCVTGIRFAFLSATSRIHASVSKKGLFAEQYKRFFAVSLTNNAELNYKCSMFHIVHS